MKNLIKDLWLAIALIVGASAVLLLSDLDQNKSSKDEKKQSYPQIAILQIASTMMLDDHIAGVIDRLQAKGFIAPDKSNIRQFNPQSDFATANTIAREITNGPYQMVITSSTPALQIFAKANQNTRKIHVFGAVTDPYGTGVGITGTDEDQHPPYIAGIGTFQPVESAFKILKELNPSIKRVGVVWNPGELCSQACLTKARGICPGLGIVLIEGVATNTSEVAEAERSLLAKGAEAIWIGGDNVALSSLSLIVNTAKQAGIPVFTNSPGDVSSGALFGLGADYFTVGQLTGDIAAAILEGKSPAEFRIENVVPEALKLDKEWLSRLGNSWKLNAEIEKRLKLQVSPGEPARTEIDFAALTSQGISPTLEMIEKADLFVNVEKKYGRPVKIAMINLVENPLLEDAEKGVVAGLTWSGLEEGKDFTVKKFNAQGEIGQLTQIIDAALQDKPDVIVSVTTPAMVAVVNKVTAIPVVFTVASDPFKLGLFKNGRQANVCGVHDDPPVDQLLDMAKEYDPGISAVGIVYDAAQPNSVLSVEKLRKAGEARKIRVVEATASSVPELSMATQSLIQRGARAIIISADNLSVTGFPSIQKVTAAAGIPVFATEPQLVGQGATGAIGTDYNEWGQQSGKMAARVIAGLPPSRLPIEPAKVNKRIDPVKQTATGISHKLYKIRLVQYSETEFAERCREGLLDGIKKSGLVEGKDYELKSFNAQGDMSTLSSIMTSVKSDNADLLLVISTPTLQAALRQAGPDVKIVFTGVGDAIGAGAGKSETDHLSNVTGITTRSSFDGMARLVREMLPGAVSVGTLFTPSEINSVLYKDWFKAELAKVGISLVEVPVTSSADLAQAATDLCGKKIQAVCQVADNTTRQGFALIARKAADQGLPVFVFDSDEMAHGAAVCLARDYYNAGLEAADKAVRVLHGESPASIPFSNTQTENLLYVPDMVKSYHLVLSTSFLEKAGIFNPSK